MNTDSSRGRWVAIVTGAISIAIAVAYLALITVLDARGPLQPLPQSTSQQPTLPPVVPHPSSLTEAPKPPTWADALSAAGQDGGEVAAAKRSRGQSASELGVKLENISLYQALVALRARLAEGKPAYQVASNQVLAMIANKRPTSRLQLLEINGIGKAKADSYGDSILRCVAEHARPKSESVAGSVDAPTAADDAADRCRSTSARSSSRSCA